MSDPNLTYTGIEIYKDILSFPKKVEFPHYAGNNNKSCVKAGIGLRIVLTLKEPNKIPADDILIFYFYLSRKIRLDFSCEPSA